MKFKLNIVFFGVSIFVLAVMGLVVFHIQSTPLTIWLIFAYTAFYPLVYATFIPALTKNGKLSGKKILLLTFSVTMIAIVATSSVLTAITPNWSFSVTTDKTTYTLGEDVEITVSLKNLGFITHSFKSAISNPVTISIEYQPTEDPYVHFSQVWYSSYENDITEFSVGPKLSLERYFVWNQTMHANIWSREEIEPGLYLIVAFIPHVNAITIRSSPIFIASTRMNITSP